MKTPKPPKESTRAAGHPAGTCWRCRSSRRCRSSGCCTWWAMQSITQVHKACNDNAHCTIRMMVVVASFAIVAAVPTCGRVATAITTMIFIVVVLHSIANTTHQW